MIDTNFKFIVKEIMQLPQHGLYHLIGFAEEGRIPPPFITNVEGYPDLLIHVKSIPLSTPVNLTEKSRKITLSIEKPSFDIQILTGCTLINAQSIDEAET